MTKDLYEAETGSPDLVFASDLGEETRELKLQAGTLYEAGEVRDEIENPETPSYGNWIPIQEPGDTDGDQSFCQAPAELVEAIQDLAIEPGDTFRVTRCEKSGSEDYAPYEVNVEKTT